LVVETTVANAGRGSTSEAPAPGAADPSGIRSPLWHRTSVIWSAVTAVAAATTALLGWKYGS
jgi:hypothetical protein